MKRDGERQRRRKAVGERFIRGDGRRRKSQKEIEGGREREEERRGGGEDIWEPNKREIESELTHCLPPPPLTRSLFSPSD